MTCPDLQVRQLAEGDLADYKALRLAALRSEPGNYCSSFEREKAMGDEQWLERLCRPDGALFGLFEKGQLKGITGVVIDKDDPAQAVLVQSYLVPELRGKGLSRLLYQPRLEWARRQPDLLRVVASHRSDNLASRGAMLAHGFKATHTEPYTWPDGAQSEHCHYALELEVQNH